MSPEPPSQRLNEHLAHLLDALDCIAEYTRGLDEHGFRSDRLRQHAVLLNLQNLGEASRRILRDDPGFASTHPRLALSSAYQLRNAIVHGYDQVDLGIIWRTVTQDLPGFRQELLAAGLSKEPAP